MPLRRAALQLGPQEYVALMTLGLAAAVIGTGRSFRSRWRSASPSARSASTSTARRPASPSASPASMTACSGDRPLRPAGDHRQCRPHQPRRGGFARIFEAVGVPTYITGTSMPSRSARCSASTRQAARGRSSAASASPTRCASAPTDASSISPTARSAGSVPMPTGRTRRMSARRGSLPTRRNGSRDRTARRWTRKAASGPAWSAPAGSPASRRRACSTGCSTRRRTCRPAWPSADPASPRSSSPRSAIGLWPGGLHPSARGLPACAHRPWRARHRRNAVRAKGRLLRAAGRRRYRQGFSDGRRRRQPAASWPPGSDTARSSAGMSTSRRSWGTCTGRLGGCERKPVPARLKPGISRISAGIPSHTRLIHAL